MFTKFLKIFCLFFICFVFLVTAKASDNDVQIHAEVPPASPTSPSPTASPTYTPSPAFPPSPAWIDIFTGYLLAKIMYILFAFLTLAIFLDSFLDWFIYLGKKKWGIVYDAESKKSIPDAKVMLYDFETEKILEESTTDNLGRYGFDIKPGNYYIVVEKTEHGYPSKITKRDYHKEIIEIKEKSEPIINIPVDVSGKVGGYRLSLLDKIAK